MWPIGFAASTLLSLGLPTTLAALLLILDRLAWFLYTVVMHARYGQTVGKMVTKVRVVDFPGEGPISWRQAWLREGIPIVLSVGVLVYEVAGVLTGRVSASAVATGEALAGGPFWLLMALPLGWFLAEVLTMLTNDKRRALHDLVAKTVVIRTNLVGADAPPTLPASPPRAPSSALACAFLVLWPNPAAGQQDLAIEVPKEIVAQLLEEGYELEVSAAGTASNLEAHSMELNRGGERELRVHGLGIGICGAANCVTWVYQKAGNGYRRLLDAGSVNRIELQRSWTKGYRDLMTVLHGSAWESYLTLYRFDGERYQRDSCFFRTYQYEDRHGSLREWKRPKITKVECDPEEELSLVVSPAQQVDDAAAFEIAATDRAAVAEFLHALQTAVAKDDRDAVAELVSYPLHVYSRKRLSVGSRQEFLRRYPMIFTARVKRSVAAARLETLFANWQGVMFDSGRVWFAPDEQGALKIVTINKVVP